MDTLGQFERVVRTHFDASYCIASDVDGFVAKLIAKAVHISRGRYAHINLACNNNAIWWVAGVCRRTLLNDRNDT